MRSLYLALTSAILAATTAFSEGTSPANVIYTEGAVIEALTAQAGDPGSGRKIFMNRKQGNCLACHVNTEMSDQLFHGEVGPALDGVAARWEEHELRGIVANSKLMFEGTIMPAFYKDSGFERSLEKFQGKTILNAQQVEDVVAYLLTLKEN
jgi:sulfur-oxidizing protein SoxX